MWYHHIWGWRKRYRYRGRVKACKPKLTKYFSEVLQKSVDREDLTLRVRRLMIMPLSFAQIAPVYCVHLFAPTPCFAPAHFVRLSYTGLWWGLSDGHGLDACWELRSSRCA